MSVLVVGAGIAGLAAASHLAESGIHSLVVDKGRAVGGRMATRRSHGARFDHGAQHIGARNPDFLSALSSLESDGVVKQWFDSGSASQPNPRYVGVDGMRGIPESLATHLDVRTSTSISRIERSRHGIQAFDKGGLVAEAPAAIVTPPVPQTLRLLDSGGIRLPCELREKLDRVRYKPCLAVLLGLRGPSGLPAGHLTVGDESPVAWIADNHHKGVSAVPALTVHSSATFAWQHLDSDSTVWIETMIAHAAPHLESAISHATGHRWRYSQPAVALDGPALVDDGPPIILTGDAFAGPRVESAFLSGIAAARTLLDTL